MKGEENTQIQEQLRLQNELFQKNLDLREKELEKQSAVVESNILRAQAEKAAKDAADAAKAASDKQVKSLEGLIRRIDQLLEYFGGGHLEREFGDVKHALNVQTNAIEGVALVVLGRSDGVPKEELMSLLRSALTRPDQVQRIGGLEIDSVSSKRDAHITGGDSN